jgi:protein required for attachment to host cells
MANNVMDNGVGIQRRSAGMKKRVTWIIVADGSRARVLANDGPGKGLRPAITGEFHHDAPPTHLLGTSKPERVARWPAPIAAPSTHMDWHQFEKDKFGREMAGLLNDAAEKKSTTI